MDKQTVFRTTSLLGLTSTFYLSGFGFSASHLTIPPLLVINNNKTPETLKQGLSVFKYVFQQGKPAFIALAVASILSSGASSYLSAALASSGTASVSSIVGKILRANAGLPSTLHVLSGLLVLSTLPLTQIVMMPDILTLVACEEDAGMREKVGEKKILLLLKQWMDRNYLRSGLLFVAGVVSSLAVYWS